MSLSDVSEYILYQEERVTQRKKKKRVIVNVRCARGVDFNWNRKQCRHWYLQNINECLRVRARVMKLSFLFTAAPQIIRSFCTVLYAHAHARVIKTFFYAAIGRVGSRVRARIAPASSRAPSRQLIAARPRASMDGLALGRFNCSPSETIIVRDISNLFVKWNVLKWKGSLCFRVSDVK